VPGGAKMIQGAAALCPHTSCAYAQNIEHLVQTKKSILFNETLQ